MSFNKSVTFLCAILVGLTCNAQTIINGGYVSGTWSIVGNPYHVLGDIIVDEDSVLNINDGVEIYFADTAGLEVYGGILAIGKFPILLTALDSSWKGISIYGDGQPGIDSVIFELCEIQFASASEDSQDGGGLYIANRNDVRFTSCTIEENYAERRGGGIYIESSNIFLYECNIMWNQTGLDPVNSKGGGVYIKDSDPSFNQCYFYNNHGAICGALYSENSSPSLLNCSFSNNSSLGGGGAVVFNDSGQPQIKNCDFILNEANGSGGAIAFLENIQAIVENCSFNVNSSSSNIYLSDGGAVLITPYDNEISFESCYFYSNYAEDFGGALYSAAPTNVINCLFWENSMPLDEGSGGGAIAVGETNMRILNTTFLDNYAAYGPTIYNEDAAVLLMNSILWDLDPGITEPGIFLSTNIEPPELLVDHSDIKGGIGNITGTGSYLIQWADGNIDLDPEFVSPPTVNYHLAWNSPCINAGRSDTLALLIPAMDLAGAPRIMGGEIDMGCYEYQQPIFIPEINDETEFLIYPNPAKEHFYIKNNSETGFEGLLIITDLSGRVLIEKKVFIGEHTAYRQYTNTLRSGFYIVNIRSKNFSDSQKLLVN